MTETMQEKTKKEKLEDIKTQLRVILKEYGTPYNGSCAELTTTNTPIIELFIRLVDIIELEA